MQYPQRPPKRVPKPTPHDAELRLEKKEKAQAKMRKTPIIRPTPLSPRSANELGWTRLRLSNEECARLKEEKRIKNAEEANRKGMLCAPFSLVDFLMEMRGSTKRLEEE